MVADLREDAAERVAAAIRDAGGQARAVRADVSREADTEAMRDATLSAFGDVHIVVNNAGTTHRNKPILEVTEEEFDRVYAVNVKSIFWSARAFIAHFRQRGGGVSSISHRPPASGRVRDWSGTTAARAPSSRRARPWRRSSARTISASIASTR